jgi:hypothetical protein
VKSAQHLTDLAIELREEMRRFTPDAATRAEYLTNLGDFVRLRDEHGAARKGAA